MEVAAVDGTGCKVKRTNVCAGTGWWVGGQARVRRDGGHRRWREKRFTSSCTRASKTNDPKERKTTIEKNWLFGSFLGFLDSCPWLFPSCASRTKDVGAESFFITAARSCCIWTFCSCSLAFRLPSRLSPVYHD